MTEAGSRARATAVVAAVIGLLVATAVIAYFNVGAVIAAIRPIGASGFLTVIAIQVALFAPLGLAWRMAAPRSSGRAAVFIWARLMREAASDVLPFSQLGGIVISARAAVLGGVASATAFGSCVVDITVEIAAQILYTLIGVCLFVYRLGGAGAAHGRLLYALVAGMIVAVGVVVGMVATQRRGLNVLERLMRHLIPGAAGHTMALSEMMETVYGQPLRLLAGLALHLAAWFGGAAGSWLILSLIGRPISFASVVAIESLLFAIRNAAFMVPGGLGVQEGAYALIGPMFGLPAEAALALSLLKRARDITIGIPTLLTWQLAESRRLHESRA